MILDPETERELREQILLYQCAQGLTDVERANLLKLPKGTRIREGAKILSLKNLKMGVNNWIGENAILDASGGLEIGNNNSIGLSVFVWSHSSHKVNLTGENTKKHSNKIIRATTKIGDNCFIAGHSVIMPGVTIGDRCIISPMSVVYEDLPARSVYAPYKKILGLDKKVNNLEIEVENLKKALGEQC